MVAFSYNTDLRGLRQEDYEFKSSLGCTVMETKIKPKTQNKT
jgi:hypothetical protein